jgi:indolepyruvate ferredoxin oxidoreductase
MTVGCTACASLPDCEQPYNILINGIGGTGVITVGALMGMAAHIEGKGASVLDMTGMSQKNGSVTSHVNRAHAGPPARAAHRHRRSRRDPRLRHADRRCADAVSKMRPGRTLAMVNLHEQPPAPSRRTPTGSTRRRRARADRRIGRRRRSGLHRRHQAGHRADGRLDRRQPVHAGLRLAARPHPAEEESLLRAIELNGVAVASNKKSFLWGRRAAVDLKRVERIATPAQAVVVQMPQSLDTIVAKRMEFLTAYQNAAYANTYSNWWRRCARKKPRWAWATSCRPPWPSTTSS